MASKKSKDAAARAAAAEVAQKYQKLEPREHVLLRSSMYIGSTEQDICETWVQGIQDDQDHMIKKSIAYVPGLFKIFDEILVNTIDHAVRLKAAHAKDATVSLMKTIRVDIARDTGVIQVFNDGDGIEIVKHPEHGVMVPELIFGNLLTSTNYDDKEERTIGGLNGLGAKACNIFSKWFEIETVDHTRKKAYKQRFSDNMSEKTDPDITRYTKKPYTTIRFLPDYTRFGSDGLCDDMYALMKKRVYDACAVTGNEVSVHFNGAKLEYKNFEKYVDLYLGTKDQHPRVYEKIDDRWEVVASFNDGGGFQQVSFVNGIWTIRGGKHVECISNQIVKQLTELAQKKRKDVSIKPQYIKDNMFLFVKSVIVNPHFDSQTKETLTTPVSKFGSKPELSEKFIEKMYKSGIIEKAISIGALLDTRILKKSDGKKRSTITGIPTLDDANWAGTSKSRECTLILTEGLSAKTMAIAGISVVGRDRWGVFPLRGKVMNVKDVAAKKIYENQEISHLKKILGLESGKEYASLDDLRYGRVMLMVDADVDGSHIKGLLFNLFHSLWPSLVSVNDFRFVCTMLTPIVKVFKGKESRSFYCLGDFEEWKGSHSATGWTTKYYKGLGTSTDEEAVEYFTNMKNVAYTWTPGDPEVRGGSSPSESSLDLAFNKARADDRKEWLGKYDKNAVLDYKDTEVSYEDFVHRELIHFSNYDLERSIPNMCDGLKVSQRKIMYCAFKKPLWDKEIRVAQFAAYVSENSAYHHGEASLQMAVVGMAQNFVGSNNINLLRPNGQFGCLDPNTDIVMWDATIKKAKDINIGDQLVGDDGTVRNVLKTTSGVDDMYEVKMIDGHSYKVNSQHLLTLKYKANKSIFWRESDKSWRTEYFDTVQNKNKSASVRTIETTKNNHFNAAKLTKEEAYEKIRKQVDGLEFSKIFDIKMEDYLKLSKSARNSFYCVKNSTHIEWDAQEVPIDPYVFGCWLGDGSSCGTGMTSMDEEILKEFALFMDTISCEIVHDINNLDKDGEIHEGHHFTVRKKDAGFRTSIGDEAHGPEACIGCQTSGVKHPICLWKYNKSLANPEHFKGQAVNGMRREDMNPWKELLRKNNLFDNKHVPMEYIKNSKEARLEFLAGIVDTDGSVKYNGGIPIIEISQSKRLRKRLIVSIELVCNSLGYRTSVATVKRKDLTKKGESKDMLNLLVYGDNLDQIPTRVPRKKIVYQKERVKDAYVSAFTVTHLGQGEFCGWSVDGNERFLLGDFTVTHNSKIHGGKDASSPRYIYTQLESITRTLFVKEDNDLMKYLDDDGYPVEPEHYIPIIPMLLVNGAVGIGTGFSTNVPCYNPTDIIAVIKTALVSGPESILPSGAPGEDTDLAPFYRGFEGTIRRVNGKWTSKGVLKRTGPTKAEVVELPIGTWTADFKEFLEGMLDEKGVKSYESHYSAQKVRFVLHFASSGVLDDLMAVDDHGNTKLETMLKLTSTKNLGTNNMYAFNENGQITKYESARHVIHAFFRVRMRYYTLRKQSLIDKISSEVRRLNNKIRFVSSVIDGSIALYTMRKQELEEALAELEYDLFDGTYDYLTKIPIYNFTLDKVQELRDEIAKKDALMAEVLRVQESDMWKRDLDDLDKAYASFVEEWYRHNSSSAHQGSSSKKTSRPKKK
jgi:DNA gyrase/topoisomerase IV subunit B